MINKNIKKKIVCKVIKINKNKTILVSFYKIKKHNFYKKFIKFYKKIHVHDEKNIAKINDYVIIENSKPISKTKFWTLKKIIKNNL